MSERNGSLSPDQLRAVGVLAGADPAELADCDPDAVAGWMAGDPEFIAGLNRAKSYRQERLRAEILSLTTGAVKTLRQMVSGLHRSSGGPAPGLPGDPGRGQRDETRDDRLHVGPGRPGFHGSPGVAGMPGRMMST